MASGSPHSERGKVADQGNRPKRRTFKIDGGVATIIAAIILAAGGVAGVAIGRATASGGASASTASDASHGAASVTITEPPTGDVKFNTNLSGKVSKLQRGELIWTFAQPVNNGGSFSPNTYPTTGPCTVNYTNGTWICNNVYIGDVKDSGTYRVCAAIVNSPDTFIIVQLLENSETTKVTDRKSWFTSPPSYIHDNTSSCMTVHRID
jgi:hypothetical protein